MHMLGWIRFGLVVGSVAKLLMPGRDRGGSIIIIALGSAGALLEGWICRAVGWYRPEDPVGFVMAVINTMILLALYHFTFRSRAA